MRTPVIEIPPDFSGTDTESLPEVEKAVCHVTFHRFQDRWDVTILGNYYFLQGKDLPTTIKLLKQKYTNKQLRINLP